jgi:serine phosphatase RsbU (regulator of sigma subunit)
MRVRERVEQDLEVARSIQQASLPKKVPTLEGWQISPYYQRNGDAEELRARGMPLGLMPAMSYEEKETILHSGEAALLYSDGLVEAHDPQGGMFGFPKLRTLVAEHGEKRSLGELLLEELNSYYGALCL